MRLQICRSTLNWCRADVGVLFFTPGLVAGKLPHVSLSFSPCGMAVKSNQSRHHVRRCTDFGPLITDLLMTDYFRLRASA